MNEDMNTTENKLPQIEANETVEAHEEKNVQLSMDPSIQEEEEAKLAQKENDVKLKAILEGLLFLVGDDGLTVEQASKSMDISTKKAEQLFDALQKDYVDDSRGFEIERYGSRYLIKEEGRSDAPGRPFLYSVTDEFMDAFKLLSLDELPDLPEFNKDNNDDLFHS